MKKYAGLIFLIAFFFSSCEKNIQVIQPQSSAQLVVEGVIETNRPPVVVLTHSLNYFSFINDSILEGMYVHGAKVQVVQGGDTVLLKEFASPSVQGMNTYYYTQDSSGLFGTMTGQWGHSYQLFISAEGKNYQAITTIPASGMILDSIWTLPPQSRADQDSGWVLLEAMITDPPARGKYIRYFTKRNQEPFYSSRNSVEDDQITAGTTFEVILDRGVNKNLKTTGTGNHFFHLGDTVTVKFCDIDSATYNFWRTWEYSYSATGNPFSSPVKILGNIPGALGYWGGYGVQLMTLIVPK
ncbi:MAG: DUF4249 domain-containing protein [Chitinophagaceae bacterium]